jgi:hypothetical protein
LDIQSSRSFVVLTMPFVVLLRFCLNCRSIQGSRIVQGG